jgi:hypothetical protein
MRLVRSKFPTLSLAISSLENDIILMGFRQVSRWNIRLTAGLDQG